MNTEDIKTLQAYNRWANHRLIGTVRPLDPHDFTRDLGTSHRSVHGTLVHTLWAEWIWLQRWRGESPRRVFAPEDFADIGAIERYWRRIEYEQEGFIAQLTDNRLAERLSYENLQGQRWTYALGHMMQHVVNHSSYHRGQVVTLLRQLGKAPLPTDFLVYFDELSGGGAA